MVNKFNKKEQVWGIVSPHISKMFVGKKKTINVFVNFEFYGRLENVPASILPDRIREHLKLTGLTDRANGSSWCV